MIARARVNTNWTAAMNGMHSRNGLRRCGKNSMMSTSGMSPNTNPTTPAVVAATGRTSLGNWICLMSRSWLDHRVRRVDDRRGEPLPGQDRREDEQRIVGQRPGDDRDEDDVDGHLEQGVDDPPQVPQEGVRAALAHVGRDEVADEPPSRPDVRDALADQPDGTRVAGGVAERSRCLTRDGHRAEGYHFAARTPAGGRGIARRTGRSPGRPNRPCGGR